MGNNSDSLLYRKLILCLCFDSVRDDYDYDYARYFLSAPSLKEDRKEVINGIFLGTTSLNEIMLKTFDFLVCIESILGDTDIIID